MEVRQTIIVITGKPGSGKTTFLERLIKLFENPVGFHTAEIRSRGERIGFNAITSWGDRIILAEKRGKAKWKVGKYAVFIEKFNDRIVKPLARKIEFRDPVYIDEVGKMELLSSEFRKLVEELLRSNDKNVIFVIPFKDVDELVQRIRKEAQMIFELPMWRNREMEAYKLISDKMAQGDRCEEISADD